jgi:membrane protein required for colicin V production
MLIDVVFLILVVLAAIKGMRNGLIVALFSLIGFIVGMAAAVKLSSVAAGYIGQAVNISDRWLPLGRLYRGVCAGGVPGAARRAGLEGVVQVAMLGWLNRLGGVLFYVLLYVFIFSIVLFYLSQINIIKPEAAQESVTYGFIQPMGPEGD